MFLREVVAAGADRQYNQRARNLHFTLIVVKRISLSGVPSGTVPSSVRARRSDAPPESPCMLILTRALSRERPRADEPFVVPSRRYQESPIRRICAFLRSMVSCPS